MTTQDALLNDRSDRTDRRSGKFLTFRLGAEDFALEIRHVHEIIGARPITRVPDSPAYVCGVINLRGKVVPVVSLRSKLGMPQSDATGWFIIVVHVKARPIGIVVDQVSDVMTCSASSVADVPSFGFEIDTDYLLGLDKSGDRVRLLLDIERVLSGSE